MSIPDSEKRTRGLKALSAFKSGGLRSNLRKGPKPPSPDDEPIDIPDYLAAGTVPPFPSDKQLPQLPPVNNFARHEASGSPPPPPPPSVRPGRNQVMGMAAMPMNTAPVPQPLPADIPAPPEVPAKPMRSSTGPMNYSPMNLVPGGDVDAATVPHSPTPIRPPSIPVVGRIPSDESRRSGIAEGDERAVGFTRESSSGNATPVAYRDPEEVNGVEPEEAEEERPETATPFVPINAPFVPAPLNDIHFNCYQEHRSMPIASNVCYPVPCMACHKHDQENRYRCVFCSLRVCNSCVQILQQCQRRSLKKLLEELQD